MSVTSGRLTCSIMDDAKVDAEDIARVKRKAVSKGRRQEAGDGGLWHG